MEGLSHKVACGGHGAIKGGVSQHVWQREMGRKRAGPGRTGFCMSDSLGQGDRARLRQGLCSLNGQSSKSSQVREYGIYPTQYHDKSQAEMVL